MDAYFADTSFYIALLNPRDSWHSHATEISRQARLSILASWFVLLELGSALRQGSDRRLFAEFVHLLQIDPTVTLVPPSVALLDDALTLFHNRQDKTWSLTDCSSFVIMQQAGINQALSLDHHFEQAGFEILLK
jgi:predicted nucleic acid-binding protein